MLGNLHFISKNYRIAYIAYLCALIGNFVYIVFFHPSWTFSLPTIIVLFAIDCFFFSKSKKKSIWPILCDSLFYILLLILIFQ
ncbi:hypothetical protein IGI41_000989 [Enterococcus sp. DIV0876]